MKRQDLLALEYYKKSTFTGSIGNFRYKVSKFEEDDNKLLRLATWQGPFAFDYTDDNEKTFTDFEYSDDGLFAIAEHINKLLLLGAN